jgi:uncharacterized protein YjbJ (UPF0337 family)
VHEETTNGETVGITDKITGRVKQAMGDLTCDEKTHKEGRREERKGEVKDQAQSAEEEASRKRAEAADLERKT